MKNLLVGQSGGPTAVINSSLAGVIAESIKASQIEKTLGAVNGIEGILSDNIIDLSDMTEERITLLKQTPSSYLGSCRKKLPEHTDDEETYKKIFEVFKKHNIGYFLYIGGNDSMDTVKKLSAYCKLKNIDVKIIGVPKTIDNDLCLTDHTPGYGSAAKFIVNAIRQLALDTAVYSMKSIIVLEIMGRNAGWLAATAALANSDDLSPVDIICLPEVPFDCEKFLKKVQAVMEKKNITIIAVSEGIKDTSGEYITQSSKGQFQDGFSHAALGGVGKYIENLISTNLKIKTRSIELSTLQRCFSATSSKTDIDEAFASGKFAVNSAISGMTGIMPGFKRLESDDYKIEIIPFDVNQIANFEKEIPEDMIAGDGFGVTDKFLDYARPLIAGENPIIYKNGLMQFEMRK